MKVTRLGHDPMVIAIKFESKTELCNLWNRVHFSDAVVKESIVKPLPGMNLLTKPFCIGEGNNFVLWEVINDMIKELEE